MRTKKYRYFKKNMILGLIFLFLPFLFATDFTYTSPGAKANSMGSAFSSIADTSYAVFYNPAGLTQLKNTELSSGMSRRLSENGNLGEVSISYGRPLPDTENSVFGFGYEAIRQAKVGEKDAFLFGYSDQFTLKYFQLPIMWGGNFKIISLRYPDKTHFGFGLDGGLIFSSKDNFKTAFVLSDLDVGIGKSLVTFTIGNSWLYNNTLFAMDFKIRGGYSEFFPGIEHRLFNDLLRIRAGKGVNLEGNNFMVLGLGFNLDPLVVDVSYSLPWEGLHEKAGLYEFNFTYKFEAPNFNEKLVEEASAKLAELNRKIDDLRKQKSDLEIQITKYQTNKSVLESDLTLIHTRMREMEEKVKQLEIEAIDAQFKKQNPPKKPVPVKKEEKWPKIHKVVTGDTLRSIAAKYYGNQNLWQLIYDANQDKVYRGLPKEGEILKIPAPVEK